VPDTIVRCICVGRTLRAEGSCHPRDAKRLSKIMKRRQGKIWIRLAVAGIFALVLEGCAGGPGYSQMPSEVGRSAAVESDQLPLECVPYARLHSSVKIYGDAYTWWDKAAGRYARRASPQEGAVMVLNGYAGPDRSHVAVVRKIISPREIRVDHANWLDDGSIYVDDPVVDVSTGNDWTKVRVWNIKTGGWGGHVYPVQGFIGPDSGTGDDLVASASIAGE
jgi:hypothetical protein